MKEWLPSLVPEKTVVTRGLLL